MTCRLDALDLDGCFRVSLDLDILFERDLVEPGTFLINGSVESEDMFGADLASQRFAFSQMRPHVSLHDGPGGEHNAAEHAFEVIRIGQVARLVGAGEG